MLSTYSKTHAALSYNTMSVSYFSNKEENKNKLNPKKPLGNSTLPKFKLDFQQLQVEFSRIN